jgi:hydrogenase maturation factor
MTEIIAFSAFCLGLVISIIGSRDMFTFAEVIQESIAVAFFHPETLLQHECVIIVQLYQKYEDFFAFGPVSTLNRGTLFRSFNNAE